MKTKTILLMLAMVIIASAEKSYAQWAPVAGTSDIYNFPAGRVGIKVAPPVGPLYPLDVSNDNNYYLRTLNVNHSVNLAAPNTSYGVFSTAENSNSGDAWCYYGNNLTSIDNGGGGQQGGYLANILSTGGGNHYGFKGILNGGNGNHWGSFVKLQGNGNGKQYGFHVEITNVGIGNKYGVYSDLSAAAGTKYGVYSDATGSTNWAFYGKGRGYFSDFVGVGTSSPNAQLHVNTAAGVPFRVQIAGASKLTVGSGGGISIGANNDSPPTNGLYVAGSAGIRTMPAITGFHLLHDYGQTTNGLRIENSASNHHQWTIYTNNDDDYLHFLRAGTLEVRFMDDGSIDQISDARMKKDVEDLYPVLDKIQSLKPKTYRFINKSADSRKSIGFIAQDLEKVFPEFVHYGGDGEKLYSVNYAGLSVIALKAIQEESDQIEELKQTVAELQSKINNLEPTTVDGIVKIMPDASMTTPLLGQNIPNPFDQSTVIPFRIPKNCSDASIVISESATGKIVRAIPISCSDTQLAIEAGLLTAGTYSYSLIVDGKMIDSMQMVLTR